MASLMVLNNLKETLTELINQVPDTPENKNKIDIIKKELDTLSTNIKQVDDYEFNTTYIKEKTQLVLSLRKFIIEFCKVTPKIYGSFIRQLLEKAFASVYDTTGYGNSINHDIDISVFKDKEEYNYFKNYDRFTRMCRFFDKISKTDITFNGFKLREFNNSTLEIQNNKINCNCGSIYCRFRHKPTATTNTTLKKLFGIPHYHVIFTKTILGKETNIMIDLFSYTVTSEDTEYNVDGDININKLELTSSGIITRYNDFTEVLNCIVSKIGICNINFDAMFNKPSLWQGYQSLQSSKNKNRS